MTCYLYVKESKMADFLRVNIHTLDSVIAFRLIIDRRYNAHECAETIALDAHRDVYYKSLLHEGLLS